MQVCRFLLTRAAFLAVRKCFFEEGGAANGNL